MPSLATVFKDISFSSCLMNASGPKCSYTSELQALIQEPFCGAVVTKSATRNKRTGNPLPRYASLPQGSINAMGLPNEGILYYLHYLEQYARQKTHFLSLSGMSLEENRAMLHLAASYAHLPLFIELNLSCPNIAGKRQTAYEPEQIKCYLSACCTESAHPLGVKLPPYFDPYDMENTARILADFPLSFVTCINSIGNGLMIDYQNQKTLIAPKKGLGGIGGAYIKPTALANVRMMYEYLPKRIAVIGCGGIQSGQDAYEHLLCGAQLLQIGTAFMEEGLPVFARITEELKTIMQQKGHAGISDFRGQLQAIPGT